MGKFIIEYRIVWLGPGDEVHPECGTWPTREIAEDMASRSKRELISWSPNYKIEEVEIECNEETKIGPHNVVNTR